MKTLTKGLGLAVLIFVVLGCGMVGKLAEKSLDKGLNTQRADSLWNDVPRMDGLNDSPTEDLPLTVKLMIKGYVNLILNSDKNSQNASIDWILYKYKGGTSDIRNFYTADKMKGEGNWGLPKDMKEPCLNGSDKGLDGDICVFQKLENGRQKGLIVMALPTKEKDVPVFVYFLRVEADPNSSAKK